MRHTVAWIIFTPMHYGSPSVATSVASNLATDDAREMIRLLRFSVEQQDHLRIRVMVVPSLPETGPPPNPVHRLG